MKNKIYSLVILCLIFSFSIQSFALENENVTKEQVIENLLNISEEIFKNAPSYVGEQFVGIGPGLVPKYITYPEINEEQKNKLIKEKLSLLKKFFQQFTTEELTLGKESFKTKLSSSAKFYWEPYNKEPEYPELAYNEIYYEECFSCAITRDKVKSENEEKEKILKEYSSLWEEGMITPSIKFDVEEMIEKDNVPIKLRSNYQKPITREEFVELFITCIFNAVNITPDEFLSKISTTAFFTDTDNKYAKLAYILGLVDEDTDHLFKSEETIDYKQAAVMLINYWQIETNSYKEYTFDREKEALNRAYNYKLISEEVNPDDLLTREAAIIIMKKCRQFFGDLILRGFVKIDMESLMSGFDVGKTTVKMKKSGYDNKPTAQTYYNMFMNFKMTSYIYDYNTEILNSAFLFPVIGQAGDIDNKYIDEVVRGKQTFKDYDVFTVEHNKDGYAVVITKKYDKGYLVGESYDDIIRYYDDGEILKIRDISIPLEPRYDVREPVNEYDKQTYIGDFVTSYPQFWDLDTSIVGIQATIKPEEKNIGDFCGYVLGTDVSVSINGHKVKSYNIGGVTAIALDTLLNFGYTYEVTPDNNQNYPFDLDIKIHIPDSPEYKKINDDVDVVEYKNGEVLYTLVGDRYMDSFWNDDENQITGNGLRNYVSTTGKRFILVDELWDSGLQCAEKKSVKLRGSIFYPEDFHDNNIALVRYENKHYDVQLLKKQETIDKRFILAKKYPDHVDLFLDEYAVKAWNEAKKLVNKAVDESMTDAEKVKVVDEALKNHGYYMNEVLSVDYNGYCNYDSAYEALVERHANYVGWYKAYKMCFVLAGLNTYPNPETEPEACEKNFGDMLGLKSKVAVQVDGKWEFVDFIPRVYPLNKSVTN